MEQQLATIEGLIKDKQEMQAKIEDVLKRNKDKDAQVEKMKAELLQQY